MKSIGALCCSATLAWLLLAVSARAEVTGQQRALAAGQAILGKPAPGLVLKTIDGETIDLAGLYGKKAVYLKFWATWCVPCRQQMPHFEHVYETAGPDLAVIAINVGFNDSIEAILKFRKQLKITMPIVFDDGTLAAAFHLRVTPTHIIIGRDGRIQFVGHLADQAVDAALIAARAPVTHNSATASAVRALPAVGVGDSLPQQSLRTLDGKQVNLRRSADEQKLTALVFLSPWCESYLATTRAAVSASCRSMRTQVETLVADQHVRWLGIASGLWADADDLQEYRTKYKVTLPLTLDADGAVFRTFRVNAVPTVIIANADGHILRRIDGGTAEAAALSTVIATLAH